MSIKLVRGESECGHQKTATCPSSITRVSGRIETDAGEKFPLNLENGATIGYKSDVGAPPPQRSSLAKQNIESTANNVCF